VWVALGVLLPVISGVAKLVSGLAGSDLAGSSLPVASTASSGMFDWSCCQFWNKIIPTNARMIPIPTSIVRTNLILFWLFLAAMIV
jgi:hypothetical protein